MPTQGYIESMQQIEVIVQGPDDINRMFITTGIMRCNLSTHDNTSGGTGRNDDRTYAALIDPVLLAGTFRRAIVDVSPSSTQSSISSNGASSRADFAWKILDAQADYDDESGKVQLLVTPSVYARGAQNAAYLTKVSFQVTTLASIPQT